MKLKKFLLGAFILALLTTAAFAVDINQFKDLPSDPAQVAVLTHAVENGLLNGVSDTEIQPNTTLTREQMAAILTRALGVTKTADISKYKDVNKSMWSYDAISKAVAIGAMNGTGNTTMSPKTPITMEQAFTVVARIFDLQYTSTNAIKYTDANKISSWALDSVNKIVTGGYWTGEGTLQPQKAMTRLEFATLMDKLVTTYIRTAGTYDKQNFTGNVVILASGVTITNTNTNYDIYIADGVTGTTEITNSSAERVVVRGGAVHCTGTYGWVRAVADDTSIIYDSGLKLKDKAKDGVKGKIYADPDKTNCYISLGTISM